MRLSREQMGECFDALAHLDRENLVELASMCLCLARMLDGVEPKTAAGSTYLFHGYGAIDLLVFVRAESVDRCKALARYFVKNGGLDVGKEG